MKTTSRCLCILLALLAALSLASLPAAAYYDEPWPMTDTAYWTEMHLSEANADAKAIYDRTAQENLVLVFYSYDCGYCIYDLPQYRDYVNEKQIPVKAYGYDRTAPDGADGAMARNMWYFFSGTIGWPVVIVYRADSKTYTASHAVRSLEAFSELTKGMQSSEAVVKHGELGDLSWSLKRSGELSVQGQLEADEQVYLAAYDEAGRMCSLEALTVSGESVFLEEGWKQFRLFRLGADAAPSCGAVRELVPQDLLTAISNK